MTPTPLHVALWEPEIPPNTGNIARLCAATGAALHLIGRLGFRLDDRALRRAGLDYWRDLEVQQHVDLPAFEASLPGARILCYSARPLRRTRRSAIAPATSSCSAVSPTACLPT